MTKAVGQPITVLGGQTEHQDAGFRRDEQIPATAGRVLQCVLGAQSRAEWQTSGTYLAENLGSTTAHARVNRACLSAADWFKAMLTKRNRVKTALTHSTLR